MKVQGVIEGGLDRGVLSGLLRDTRSTLTMAYIVQRSNGFRTASLLVMSGEKRVLSLGV